MQSVYARAASSSVLAPTAAAAKPRPPACNMMSKHSFSKGASRHRAIREGEEVLRHGLCRQSAARHWQPGQACLVQFMSAVPQLHTCLKAAWSGGGVAAAPAAGVSVSSSDTGASATPVAAAGLAAGVSSSPPSSAPSSSENPAGRSTSRHGTEPRSMVQQHQA